MRRAVLITIIVAALPVAAAAQGFKDLDTAVTSVSRGLERGEAGQILEGVEDQVMLQFPGLLEKSGFFGRDQASYLLSDLFAKVKPSRFEVVSARKVSAQSQYHITANWTIQPSGDPETREVLVTLQNRADRWYVASIRSGSDR